MEEHRKERSECNLLSLSAGGKVSLGEIHKILYPNGIFNATELVDASKLSLSLKIFLRKVIHEGDFDYG